MYPTPRISFITAVALICCCLQAGTVSFEFKDKPLDEAIGWLVSEKRAPILYVGNILRNKTVNVTCRDCTMEEALDALLYNLPVSYKKHGSQYVLRPARLKQGRIEGRIVLKNSGSGVSYTAIILEDCSKLERKVMATGISDENGYFEFARLKHGTYAVSLNARDISNVTVEEIEVCQARATHSVQLEVDALSMAREEIVVNSAGVEAGQPIVGKDRIARSSYRGFRGTPGSAFSPIRRLPGVAAHDWSSGDINIQGGSSRDTAVYLDGAFIQAPAHFVASGVASQGIIDDDAIDDITLISGAVPIEYGDRMGGVLTMTSTAPQKPLEASLSTSTTESKVKTAGTFADNRGNWFFNLRSGYQDMVDRMRRQPRQGYAEKDAGNSDVLGKIQYFFNESHLISVHLLQGNSNYDYVDHGNPVGIPTTAETVSREQNRTTWLNLKSFWTSNLWSETVLTYNQYDSNFQSDHTIPGFYVRDIDDSRSFRGESFRQNWNLTFGKHHLKWGLRARQTRGFFDFQDEVAYPERAADTDELSLKYKRSTLNVDEVDNPDREGGSSGTVGILDDGHYKHTNLVDAHSREYGLYLGDRFQMTDRLETDLAVRYDQQSHTGDHQWSPRMNVNYEHNRQTTLRFSWGRFYQPQAVHQLEIYNRQATYSPAELSEHVLFGIAHRFSGGISFNGELYTNNYSSLRGREFTFNSSYLDEPTFVSGRTSLQPTSGISSGFKLTLRDQQQRPFGWMVNYTLSKAEDEIEGKTVARQWDQRHAVNAVVNYKYHDRLHLTLAWQWHTGWPTTDVWLGSVQNEQGVTIPQLVHGPLNADNLPDYQRVDLRMDQQVKLGGTRKFYWYMEITNLLNRENTTGHVYSIATDLSGEPILKTTPRNWEGLLPVIGMRWDF